MSKQPFELKGSLFTLSVLHLHDAELTNIHQSLNDKISQAPNFFLNAPIVVNLESLEETPAIDFDKLASILRSLNLTFVGITSTSPDIQKDAARNAGISVVSYSAEAPKKVTSTAADTNKSPEPQRQIKIVEKPVTQAPLVIENTVRSGQQVYAQDQDLVVLGAVSNGAEVISDGNIHIYGSLRGRAIAGAKGDVSARIFVQKLEAELVSVSGNYLLSEHLQDGPWSQPACVQLVDEKIMVKAID